MPIFALFALLLHIGLGILLYFALYDFISQLSSGGLIVFTLTLVGLVTLIRGVRTSRISEVFRAGPHSAWGIFAVLSLLGPCESIIPIFIKANQLGMGYLAPFSAFRRAGKSFWERRWMW